MSRHKIELHLENIQPSIEYEHAYVLILKESGGGDRMISVIIGEYEARSIIMEWKGVATPRPLTHNLFGTILETLNISLERVTIHRVDKGVYYTYLYLKQGTTLMRIDARTSDAVAMAVRMRAPIYTYEDVIDHERIRNAEPTDTAFVGHDSPDPSNDAPKTYNQLDRLEQDLQRAIEEEEYELAAKLRDIISKLKEE